MKLSNNVVKKFEESVINSGLSMRKVESLLGYSPKGNGQWVSQILSGKRKNVRMRTYNNLCSFVNQFGDESKASKFTTSESTIEVTGDSTTGDIITLNGQSYIRASSEMIEAFKQIKEIANKFK